VIDLGRPAKAGIPASCSTGAWKRHLTFEQPAALSNANGDAYQETVISLDLDPAKGCNCAVFRIHYDTRPRGFTVDIGDSPTSDGFGGDAGTTVFSAEAQVLEDTLSVFTAEGPRAGPIEDLIRSRLPSIDRMVLELRVCDQSIALEVSSESKREPAVRTLLQTPRTARLFALRGERDPQATLRSGEADTVIYAAFNRVIASLKGAPEKHRVGSGVRRVEVFLTP